MRMWRRLAIVRYFYIEWATHHNERHTQLLLYMYSSRFHSDSMKRQSLMHVCKKRMKIGAWHIYIWGSTLKWIPRITIMIQNVHYHFTM